MVIKLFGIVVQPLPPNVKDQGSNLILDAICVEFVCSTCV